MVISEVPLSTLLAVSSSSVAAANVLDPEVISQEVTWYRQQQLASAEGCFVVHKKRGNDKKPQQQKQEDKCPITLACEKMDAFAKATSSTSAGPLEIFPFWQHVGLEVRRGSFC